MRVRVTEGVVRSGASTTKATLKYFGIETFSSMRKKTAILERLELCDVKDTQKRCNNRTLLIFTQAPQSYRYRSYSFSKMFDELSELFATLPYLFHLALSS